MRGAGKRLSGELCNQTPSWFLGAGAREVFFLPLQPCLHALIFRECLIRSLHRCPQIGFVEHASIDWCANPRLKRAELRELLAQILFAIMTGIAPQFVPR